MPKFYVRFTQEAVWEVEVEASDEKEAEKLGWEALEKEQNMYMEEYIWTIEGDPEFEKATRLPEKK